MKAEQRKELETNALADRMGRAVQRMKTQPRRMTFYWVVAGAVVFAALFFTFLYFQRSKEWESQRWKLLDIGASSALEPLLKEPENTTNAGKAARFQVAWFLFWDAGVKRLGIGNGMEGMQRIEQAAQQYTLLAKECENDPVWEPEAMYALAVIEETRAVEPGTREGVLKRLESAKERYEELAKKHDKSARGQLAKEWVTNYENETKRNELADFYVEMHQSLRIVPPDLFPKKGFNFGKGAAKEPPVKK